MILCQYFSDLRHARKMNIPMNTPIQPNIMSLLSGDHPQIQDNNHALNEGQVHSHGRGGFSLPFNDPDETFSK